MLKNKYGFMAVMLLCIALFYTCGKEGGIVEKNMPESDKKPEDVCREITEGKPDLKEQTEKGYNLPVDDSQREEAEKDCKKMMELIGSIYEEVDKADVLSSGLSEDTTAKIQNVLKGTQTAVITTEVYSAMGNFEGIDQFLRECIRGVSGSAVIYEIHSSGGIGRMKFIFDGTDMYLLSAAAVWDSGNEPVVACISYTRIKEWSYTDKGWFCYELCVPEYPEVTETVDGSSMVRVIPMTDEKKEMSEKYVLGLAYQGNNLLCSEWDADHMESLDYNGMYEYLYAMKYRKQFPAEDYEEGIPKEEFESLIMAYLPVTAKEIQSYAVFDKDKQTYGWERLNCFNYAPAYFGTSVPEVTDIRENDDGTVTLTVDAVCSMILCDDAVITHELTIRIYEDGSFRYLGNRILHDGILTIPEYQYRMIKK